MWSRTNDVARTVLGLFCKFKLEAGRILDKSLISHVPVPGQASPSHQGTDTDDATAPNMEGASLYSPRVFACDCTRSRGGVGH